MTPVARFRNLLPVLCVNALLILATANVLVACSNAFERLGAAPVGPFGASADATPRPPRNTVPLNSCKSEWCKANCRAGNPNLPLQCHGFKLEE